jgi:hypothetical protein
MKSRRQGLGIALGLFMLLAGNEASASDLVLAGILDNTSGDLNPAVGIIDVVNAPLTGGGFVTGRAFENVTPFSDTLVFTSTPPAAFGTLSGTNNTPGTLGLGVELMSNRYPEPMADFVGFGFNTISVIGQLGFTGQVSSGGEFFNASSVASSFNNNPSTLKFGESWFGTVPVPTPIGFGDIRLKPGQFGGPGKLQCFVQYDAKSLDFAFPSSITLTIATGPAVPEPPSLVMGALGFCVASLISIRTRRGKGSGIRSRT